jgi:hypothetical protein
MSQEVTVMSRHISRKQRWTQQDARNYTSVLGRVVYEQNGWYSVLQYRLRVPPAQGQSASSWVARTERFGPFKRPRDAMVTLEREATALQNHHGENIVVGKG